MKTNYQSWEVSIGKLIMGGGNPLIIQSMTNTKTMDTQATVDQCKALFDAGAGLVRITARNISEAVNLGNIKSELLKNGYLQPISADIHFNPAVAMEAACHVEKIRINPGNFVDLFLGKRTYTAEEFESEKQAIVEVLKPLLEICLEHGTAIRIGINKGSLSRRMIDRFGNTTKALAASADEFAGIFQDLGFSNAVISIKASTVAETIESNIMLATLLQERGAQFPLHLGVTEAGEGEDGVIKSAIGIGTLLLYGLGDTIRVSLTGNPVDEIKPAFEITETVKSLQKEGVRVIIFPGELKTDLTKAELVFSGDETLSERENCFSLSSRDDITEYWNLLNSKNELVDLFLNPEPFSEMEIVLLLGSGLATGRIRKVHLCNEENSSWGKLLRDIVQSSGRGRFKTEFVSCPTCGRTEFEIEKVVRMVKERFADAPGLTIAVMGCIVNGPGEMKGADAGIVGSGKNMVTLFWKGEAVSKNISIETAMNELENLLGLTLKN